MARRTLDDRVWRNLKRKLRGQPQARVGVLASHGGGAPHGDSGVTNAELAAIHEFGAPGAGVPERSFIRSAMRENRVELRNMAARLARRVVDVRKGTSVAGTLSMRDALEVLGQWGVAKIKAKITSNIPPALKPATILRKTVGGKRGDVALIDTGQLLNSITHEVRE